LTSDLNHNLALISGANPDFLRLLMLPINFHALVGIGPAALEISRKCFVDID